MSETMASSSRSVQLFDGHNLLHAVGVKHVFQQSTITHAQTHNQLEVTQWVLLFWLRETPNRTTPTQQQNKLSGFVVFDQPSDWPFFKQPADGYLADNDRHLIDWSYFMWNMATRNWAQRLQKSVWNIALHPGYSWKYFLNSK